MGGEAKPSFEEVDSYAVSAGSLKDNLGLTLSKQVLGLRATAVRLSIPEFQKKAKITLVSATSIVEGGAHDVVLKETSSTSALQTHCPAGTCGAILFGRRIWRSEAGWMILRPVVRARLGRVCTASDCRARLRGGNEDSDIDVVILDEWRGGGLAALRGRVDSPA